MSSTTTRPQVDSKRAKAFFDARLLVTNAHIGKRITVFVRNDGNVIDVQDKEGNLVMEVNNPDTVLRKRIFNGNANSEAAILAANNRALREEALKAEKAGDAAKASELFNDYLNKTQFSFSVLSTSSMFDKIRGGMEVTGTVQEVVTDNGRLLTLDSSTLAIKEPEVLKKPSTSMWTIGEEGGETPDAEPATAAVAAEA
jgi:hypothetical protein